MDKKEKERIVLLQFIEAYENLNNCKDDFKILEKEAIQIKYPNYNSENPDFVVLFNDNFIGIELFELVRDNLETLNRSNSELKLNIKNIFYLHKWSLANRNGGQ